VQIDGNGWPIREFDHQSQFAAECADVSAQRRNERVVAVFKLGPSDPYSGVTDVDPDGACS